MNGEVTVVEAARQLGVQRAAVWKHIKAGHLPAEKRDSPIGPYWVIRQDVLDAFKRLPTKPGTAKVLERAS